MPKFGIPLGTAIAFMMGWWVVVTRGDEAEKGDDLAARGHRLRHNDAHYHPTGYLFQLLF